jgi:hypothetical protein
MQKERQKERENGRVQKYEKALDIGNVIPHRTFRAWRGIAVQGNTGYTVLD